MQLNNLNNIDKKHKLTNDNVHYHVYLPRQCCGANSATDKVAQDAEG